MKVKENNEWMFCENHSKKCEVFIPCMSDIRTLPGSIINAGQCMVMYLFNLYSAWIDFEKSVSDICERQILTFKVDPRSVRV